MFDELRRNIAREVSNYLFRLERVEPERTAPVQAPSQTIHSSFDVFTSGPGAAKPIPTAQRQAQLVTNRASGGSRAFVNNAIQVGRNDPCPCGSGKKYKKCCGA
ncbi:MAG: SEC-C domain-containing protein [Chitinispirillaceae bacterium]|nr:SEC-C domain-containing protein [Chitinispirillaceae bacterium]